MDKQILILATTRDFLTKFEQENVKILRRMGYVVHYAANLHEPSYAAGDDPFERMGVQAHHIDIARSPYLLDDNEKALRQVLALLQKYPICAIHCHTPVGGVLGRLAGRFCSQKGIVVVYTAHGFHFYQGAPVFNRLVYRPVEGYLARYTDILIVINEEDHRTARRFRLKKGGHVYRIPGVGLDTGVFCPLPPEKRAAMREQLGIEPGQFFLVSVGELNENKNQKIVLEALARMKRTGQDISSIRYGICGDGFFRERMQRWIVEMGLRQTVTLYGHCSRVADILGCADAAAFPSRREGLGMAGLEALAMGVPVLAADNRGTREYMEHGRNGFVCEWDDADGFIRGIRAIQKLDPVRKAAMAAYCRESVKPFEKEYTNAIMRKIYGEMERMVRRRRP